MSVSPYTVAGVALRWLYDQRINTPAILDAGRYFPGASDFSARLESLRNEALNIGDRLDHVPRFHEIMKQQTEISANDGRDWRMFVAKAYGAGVRHNLAQCPVLAELRGPGLRPLQSLPQPYYSGYGPAYVGGP